MHLAVLVEHSSSHSSYIHCSVVSLGNRVFSIANLHLDTEISLASSSSLPNRSLPLYMLVCLLICGLTRMLISFIKTYP